MFHFVTAQDGYFKRISEIVSIENPYMHVKWADGSADCTKVFAYLVGKKVGAKNPHVFINGKKPGATLNG